MTVNNIFEHIKAAVRKRAVPIHLTTGRDAEGRECWYVFICPYSELRKMQSAKAQVKPENHGYVVASGFGKYPSDKIRKQIALEYGFVINDFSAG